MAKVIVSVTLIVAISVGGIFLNNIYGSNIEELNDDENYLYIPTGSNFEDVMQILAKKNILINLSSFRWTAELMNYPKHIYPGKYKLEKKMSNRELLLKLRTGDQEAIDIMFGRIRSKRKLARYFSDNLEVNFDEMHRMLSDPYYHEKYGFEPHTVMAMFIPNTYQFNWNTSAQEVFDRMDKEYKKFWTSDRITKARALNLGLTKVDVITIASIVEEETYMSSEKPRVAGVYINRLKKKMKLQADPTLKFAAGDFTIKRVLNKHKKIDSPYNTYKYKGIPPGPICIPSIKSIDAVLNAEKHEYLFFCADPVKAGYHTFNVTYRDHERDANKYRKKLDKMGIKK